MKPIKLTRSQYRRLERNLKGQGRSEKKPKPRRVIIHVGRFIMLDVNCPNCNLSASVTLLRFIQAINQGMGWHCSDCGCDFIAKIELLDPQRSPTPRAPAKASGALCPECDSEVLGTGFCMMGHWVGVPRSGG